jgi:hypothetical protein
LATCQTKLNPSIFISIMKKAYFFPIHASLEVKLVLQVTRKVFFFFAHFFIVVLGRVHCDIYKSSYSISNISYLNADLHGFILAPTLSFLEWFQQVSFFHLHTCVHSISTVFTLPHAVPTSSKLLKFALFFTNHSLTLFYIFLMFYFITFCNVHIEVYYLWCKFCGFYF